jgi:hypothetical protein
VRKREALALFAATAAVIGLAAWGAVWLTEPPPRRAPRPAPAGPPAAAPAGEARARSPSEVADPVEAARLERLAERRADFQALRDGFAGPASPAAAARLAPALRALWPGEPPAWRAECRSRLCRVIGPGEPMAWQAALLADSRVAEVADRIATDPDRASPEAYLLLAAGPAGSGDDLLAGVEARLREAEGVAGCVAGLEGPVVIELIAEESGLAFQPAGTGAPADLRCLLPALAAAVGQASVPPGTKAARRSVTFLPAR